MAWVSSKEFAEMVRVSDRYIRKKSNSQKILSINTRFFVFINIQSRGGHSGKVLKIWDQPFSTQEEAQRFYEMEIQKYENHSNGNRHSLSAFKKSDCAFRDYEINADQANLTQSHQEEFDILTSSLKPKIADKSYFLAKEKEEVLFEWEKSQKDRNQG